MTYEPHPLDTSQLKLTDRLRELVEELARSTHDAWASQRIAEGWNYGDARDDARKQHPNLAPYKQLPESEKQYNQHTVAETIKALLAMGYRIEEPHSLTDIIHGPELTADQELEALLKLLQAHTPLDLAALFAIWRSRDAQVWARDMRIYRALGERALELSEPLLAYDVVTEGLRCQPADTRLRQLQAQVLVDGGATHRAHEILHQLYREGKRDQETLGLLGRTHKDFWAQAVRARNDEAARREVTRAHNIYSLAHALSGGYWTGINAATTALLLGSRKKAKALARNARRLSLQELERLATTNEGDRYWPLATLGEAALILGDWADVERWYTQAAEVGRTRVRALNSTRRNARLIVDCLGEDRNRVEQYFPIPKAVVFAGHMVDRPGRLRPRFPPQLEAVVREKLHSYLKKMNVGVGFSGAACGSDILFLETVLALKGEIHIVLPCQQEQFIEDSVDISPDANWRERCELLLRGAAEVLPVSEQRLEGTGLSYDYANHVLYGLSKIRAAQLETELITLAVWDGRPGDGPGGTASVVAHWREAGHKVEVIDLSKILREKYPEFETKQEDDSAYTQEPVSCAASSDVNTKMMAILLADVVHFTRLTDEQIPKFVRHFLGTVAELIKHSEHAPVLKNTWGDGLYFVFNNVRAAGLFALSLCDVVNKTNWQEKGLPEKLSLRIALHAGPVYSCFDPVLEQHTYTGKHVIRAARIEPITPPGLVYASQAFAALAASDMVSDFVCDYVGQPVLAKGYGSFPIYQVRRG